MSPDLFRIVYYSRATRGGDSVPSLERILTVSRRNNARDGLTGTLLALDGSFAQVLEGEFDAVQRTFERIQVDERHEDVILLQAHLTSTRLFRGWTMELASPDDPSAAHDVLRAAVVQSGRDSARKLVDLLHSLARREEWMTTAA